MSTLVRFMDEADATCPKCQSGDLRLRYIGDEVERIGYALFWCDACLHGISISRARATAAGDFYSFHDPDALKGVPDFTAIN